MNRLAREASSYLRQHADDPVDWYPWGAEAWGRAVAEDDLPSFRSVFDSVAEEWKDSRRSLEHQAREVVRQLDPRTRGLPERTPLSRDLLEQGIRAVVTAADQIHGGFGEAPKFPQPW